MGVTIVSGLIKLVNGTNLMCLTGELIVTNSMSLMNVVGAIGVMMSMIGGSRVEDFLI